MPYKDPDIARAYFKEYDLKRRSKRITYRHKNVRLTFNPRTGKCSNCGRVGFTHMHHDVYNEADVLANTRELCIGCHNKTRVYSSKPSS